MNQSLPSISSMTTLIVDLTCACKTPQVYRVIIKTVFRCVQGIMLTLLFNFNHSLYISSYFFNDDEMSFLPHCKICVNSFNCFFNNNKNEVSKNVSFWDFQPTLPLQFVVFFLVFPLLLDRPVFRLFCSCYLPRFLYSFFVFTFFYYVFVCIRIEKQNTFPPPQGTGLVQLGWYRK